jgi:membrane-bound lytic murein transglycosylase A
MRAGLRLLLAAALWSAAAAAVTAGPAAPAGAARRPLAFADLPGWVADDHAAAFRAFRASCAAILTDAPALRLARPASPGLVAACRAAPQAADAREARAFFETHFAPVEIVPESQQGFLTGYYEPEAAGSLEPKPGFSWPIRARPAGLATRGPDEALPGIDPELAAALRTPSGFVPLPERDAIENGAFGADAPPILYVRDEVEAFFIHVQGSARIRLAEGGAARLAYAGRNGHPYTSAGRLLATERGMAPEDLTMEKLKDWLRAHPDEGRALMRRNRSYIFFRLATELAEGDGPVGGAGVPLQAGRSLAIDRTLWSYGSPVYIAADVPEEIAPRGRIARLTVAQDTGSAIVGPARADLFFGSGEEAGRRAGALRHRMRFILLKPRADAAP